MVEPLLVNSETAVVNQLEQAKQKYPNMQILKDTIQNYKDKGYKLIGYGAAAKGNTLMNYAGLKNDLIDFVCDAAISKQNKYLYLLVLY